MPTDDRDQSRPRGPWDPPPQRAPIEPQQVQAPKWRLSWSTIIFMLLLLGAGIRAYRDMSRPDAWAYWKDQYFSPSLTASVIAKADLGGTGGGRPALAIHGTIGAAAGNWLRSELDQAHLVAGDTVLLSSPGGDLGQALIMGDIIRSRGLATAVGSVDESGRARPSYCASACVFIFAGGKPRYGVEGSLLGVHRFTTTATVSDAVADTQRTTGIVLGYMTRMGVSSTVVEAMSRTSEVRWLGPKDALAMNLVTDPLGKP